jgi:hypothetical protein
LPHSRRGRRLCGIQTYGIARVKTYVGVRLSINGVCGPFLDRGSWYWSLAVARFPVSDSVHFSCNPLHFYIILPLSALSSSITALALVFMIPNKMYCGQAKTAEKVSRPAAYLSGKLSFVSTACLASRQECIVLREWSGSTFRTKGCPIRSRSRKASR